MKGNVLARLGGARDDLLDQAAGDKAKHSSMGAVLLSTGAVAAVSAAFAVNTALKLPPVVAVIVGLIWGLVIFNLDRMLVVTMVRSDGWIRNLAIAIPRIALALILGAVVSAPLVLQIFKPEIDAELQVINRENLAAAQDRLNNDPRYTGIPDLEEEVADLQAQASGSAPPEVTTNQDVVSAQGRVTTAEDALQTAEADLRDEVDGSGGSGSVGFGPIALRLQAIVDQRAEALAEAEVELREAETRVRESVEASTEETRQQAAAALPVKLDELRRLTEDKAVDERTVREAEQGSDGLINRLKALDRLAGTPTLGAARLALLLLFASIEILPVLVKLLSLLGRPTLYDRLADQKEKSVMEEAVAAAAVRRERIAIDGDATRAEAQFEADVRRDSAQIRMQTILSMESGRAELQREAGGRNNALLVQKQEEMAVEAIERWAQVAASRTEEELDRWHADQLAGRGRSRSASPTTNGSVGRDRSDDEPASAPAAPRQPTRLRPAPTRPEPAAESRTGRREPPHAEPSRKRPMSYTEYTKAQQEAPPVVAATALTRVVDHRHEDSPDGTGGRAPDRSPDDAGEIDLLDDGHPLDGTAADGRDQRP